MLFAIKPSSYISSLCYSIFRLEPYSGCSYGCIYCYARWYRWSKPLVNPGKLLGLWKRVARSLQKSLNPPVYFRLSTLSEPFQENIEMQRVISLEMLRIALRYEIPLVVNTKSLLVTRSPWLDIILRLADKRLVLIQYSLTTINEYHRVKLEPQAPPSWRRLEAIEYLREHDVPVVARIQPLIPGIEEEQLETARQALEHGAQGLITESIRETKEGLQEIAKTIGINPREYMEIVKWEPYQFMEVDYMKPLLHPNIDWRARIFGKLETIARTYGKPLTLCKEGVWRKYSRPGFDCCQFWHTRSYYALRKTLHEYLSDKIRPYITAKILDKNDYTRYPKIVRRPLKLHHNKLEKIVKQKEKLSKLVVDSTT